MCVHVTNKVTSYKKIIPLPIFRNNGMRIKNSQKSRLRKETFILSNFIISCTSIEPSYLIPSPSFWQSAHRWSDTAFIIFLIEMNQYTLKTGQKRYFSREASYCFHVQCKGGIPISYKEKRDIINFAQATGMSTLC